ncbi:E2F/DP family winged-helix DNA-binding domain-containing protein [Mortierella sp. GBAus27b]|nr:E2F/DP family winged-helix DNA-binding domain-containing protein [Mortierella sp. GBAus27b]
MSSTTHVMTAMAPMVPMSGFSDHAAGWNDRENRPSAVASHDPTLQLAKPGKRKGNPPSKPKATTANKDSSRSERSLGMLTKQFIRLLKAEGGTLDLNNTATKLNVSKRRIYDITNVLEGIDLIEKSKKNNVRWKGVPATNINTSAVDCRSAPGLNRQRKEELLKERARLEEEHLRLMKMRGQVDDNLKDTLTNEDTARYAYITMDDIKKVDSLKDSLVLAVNTPHGTFIQVNDSSADPSKPFVMNLEHKTQAGDVKLSSFVVPPRCPGSPVDSSSDSSSEGPTDYSSLDDYSSQDDDSCSDYTEDSSSSDYSSEEYSEDSSSEDDESARTMYKTTIGKRAIMSPLSPREVAAVYHAATEGEESESESESMSE